MPVGSAIGFAARHTVGMLAQALLVLAIVAALVFAAAEVIGTGPAGANSVFAARGGRAALANGGGLSIPDGVFGGTTTATVTGGGTWVNVSCQSATGGLVSWTAADGNGNATIQLGPTPTWSSGGASCGARAGSFDNNGNFVTGASITFSVNP